VTAKVVPPGVSAPEVAVTVTEPATAPVTIFVAMPLAAVAVPPPVIVPPPDVCAKVTTVELSDVTMLPFASSTAAVSVFVEPEATLDVSDVKASFVAVPGVKTTLVEFVIAVPLTLPVTAAVPALVDDVRVSAYVPFALSVARQSVVHAVGNVPRFVEMRTVAPPVVIALPASSLAVTVITDVLVPFAVIDPELAAIVDVAADIGPGLTVNVEVAGVSPVRDAVIVIEPASAPVTVRDAIPATAFGVPRPVTVPTPAVLANPTAPVSLVTTLLFTSSTATVSVFVEPEATLDVSDVKTSFVAVPAVNTTLVEFVIATELIVPVTFAVPALVDDVNVSV